MSEATANAQKQVKPIAPKVQELIARCKSVILGTVDENGIPNASYAPYARIGNQFYILVSFMSRHTKNLKDQRKASVMFIEDESETKQIYARERLTLQSACTQIERDSAIWTEAMSLLKSLHGKVVDILENMDDFIMIELNVINGAYVNGFGSAYFVDSNLEVTEHRNDIAHTERQK